MQYNKFHLKYLIKQENAQIVTEYSIFDPFAVSNKKVRKGGCISCILVAYNVNKRIFYLEMKFKFNQKKNSIIKQ